MNRIDRLFGIVTMLQSRKFVAADQLAKKFNISVRTVYRDIKSLVELGVPVSFEQPRGYFLVQGYFLPPVSFTTEEAHALLLMESLAYGFAGKSTQSHYSSALIKVKNVLRAPQKEGLEELHNTIRLQLPRDMRQTTDHLSVIQQAIAGKDVLALEYKKEAGQLSHRHVEPIGLIYYALNWHLIAWCQLRRDYRDFKVARIVSLNPTHQPFTKTDHLALNEYMKQLPVNY